MAEVKWIKITTDIFDDEKILLIESMPDADAVIVIWFKLLCLAGKQNNSGVFTMNDKIAYTDEMLATIFRRPVNTVRMALSTFEEFGMIERIDGVITIPNWGKHQNLEQLEARREYQKEYHREYRKKQKLLVESELEDSQCLRKHLRKEDVNTLEEEREEEREEEKKEKKKKKENASLYYPEDEKLNAAFVDFVEMRKKIKKPLATERAIELAINEVNKLSGGDSEKAIAIINQSILRGWQGLFPLKEEQKTEQKAPASIAEKWANAAKGIQ